MNKHASIDSFIPASNDYNSEDQNNENGENFFKVPQKVKDARN